MDNHNAIKAHLALLAIRLIVSGSTTTGNHKQTQEAAVNLPETFAGNEEGRRTIKKKDLEALIDNRWKSQVRRLEEQIAELERRIAWAEGKLGEPEATSAVTNDAG